MISAEKQRAITNIGCMFTLVLIGFGFWGLYALQGWFNIPLWVYKLVTAFSVMYFPVMFYLEIKRAVTEESRESESKKSPPAMKVYGSTHEE